MPVLRGVDVKLVTFPTKQIIREYLHPDGTSFRLFSKEKGTCDATDSSSTANSLVVTSDPATTGRKVDPKSSVYIATQPGSQFVIAYDINRVPQGCRYMNFKVFINGRHIVTCGRDLEESHNGLISRTLWTPSDHLGARTGIEGRQFMFLRDGEAKSAAEDGGLIEVRVYRAEARTLLAPALKEFQQARQYGIATPSIGLIDKPEDVDYYKYKLIDPIDMPYARFLFHYRSLQSLTELSLIPEVTMSKTVQALGSETHSLLRPATGKEAPMRLKSLPDEELRGLPRAAPGKEFCLLPSQQLTNDTKDPSRSSSPKVPSLGLDGAFDDRPASKSGPTRDRRHHEQASEILSHDTQHSLRDNDVAMHDRSVAPSLALRRPLLELPNDCATRSKLASKSPAPSLSPSLKRSVAAGYFDDDIEIAVSKVVRYSKVLEKPTLLEVSSARSSATSPDRSSSAATLTDHSTRRTSYQQQGSLNDNERAGHNHDSSSDISCWSEPEFPTVLTPRPQVSYTQRRAQEQEQEQDQQDTKIRSNRYGSGSHGRPATFGGLVRGSADQEPRHRPQSLTTTIPTYRGTDTTMQSQVQRSPQRGRPTSDMQRPSQLSTPQRPSTYSALRDLGAQVLSGAAFRRSAQAQTPTTQGSRHYTRLLSPTRRDRVREPLQSPTPRNSESSATPSRATLADQRWSPLNAPLDPHGGVTWEDIVRQSPRHDPTIEHMLHVLNRSDSFKENRPPSDDESP